MIMSEYIHIGKIVASFGLKGELIIHHALKKKLSFKNIEALFIEDKKESYLPYFIQTSKAKDQEDIFVTLESIDSKEAAQKLIKKNVWLLGEDFRKMAGKTAPISLLGYAIIDDGKNLGTINEVIEQPHQILVQLMINGKEALIPLHEESLKKIDHKKKEVHVILPDGLLEIYC
jgi:16S rRNA processing protein RimM